MSKETPTGPTDGLPPVSELLPLGYLYLLILGIATQSIFYGLLGVNFLAWSDVLDVLISPIALLTGQIALLVTVVVIAALLYPYLKWLRYLNRNKKPNGLNRSLLEQPLARAWLQFSATVIVFAFIGIGSGAGMAVRERLSTGEAIIDHRVVFHDGREVDVELVGKNAGFLFYFGVGDTALSIVPLADNVHRVQRIGSSPGLASDPAGPDVESPDS
ncbi:MAG: hypothetical protein GW900_06275 [Gammaproteobacteria bacterium]|nr:hypothetical protein [Gammaproteobacteria bacterium]